MLGQEKELDMRVPGTIHLVDLEGTMNVRHEEGDDIVLVPQPTDDPEDPLNWVKSRKRKLAFCLMLAVFSADILSTALSAVLLDIVADTGISLADLNTGVGIQYLFFGWSCLIWQPLGLNFGRRPVILFAGLACMLCTVWSAYVKSAGEWYVNRLLVGFFYGPIETLIEVCISDVFFAHERGGWIAWYCWTLFNIPFISGIVAGFISSRYGWQWIQFIASIIASGCLIILFFCLEETMFYRDPALELDAADSVPEAITSNIEDGSTKKDIVHVGIDKVNSSESSQPENNYKTKTFKDKLKLWGARSPQQKTNFFQSMWMPFYLLRFPSVVFAGFTVGAVLSWFNVVNATIASVLSAPPYNFGANMVGVFFASPAIGISVGAYFSGKVVDGFTVRKARTGKGYREPEFRLWLSVIPMVIHPFGCLLYGIGAAKGIHWVGLAFGLGAICSTFPIGSAIAINYIIDCYKEVSGVGLVTMILIRNTMGFGFSYAVTPWLEAVGTQNLYISLACIGAFFWALSLVMIALGKKFRKITATSYWKLVETYGLHAH
ncbi:hypothetical protein PSN45_000878 [Yamadazyma tenuis]|uniref:MFS general substrate transporter n=1 Tax=Candida tenuis (strain ATCC 10573 / BCRC 21748 / CBS 615 / JCM 9827 / NBRC 10315 / NRRL Y-1498 / VKM Y-70) TaxID=590646 RepID=G3BBC7_CANTC|nr:MFS general substrate transporter [Yamadazyma tenuis ATCC 10573]EGV62153.1 MFS general substrate transporter [Yamadazyma tenuis ATCC 10573]WEJ93415.1 hypothetical protein PSN45_000878 [Yamadazyma tenuis]